MNVKILLSIALADLTLSACDEMATLSDAAGTGSQRALPSPQLTLIPTVNIAPAQDWPPGATSQAAPGMRFCSCDLPETLEKYCRHMTESPQG